MINVPSSLLYPLLISNPKKAQALTLYVALKNNGPISGRRLAHLIDMSVTQTAAWILEFDEAIEQENRTLNEQSKSLKCDVSCKYTKREPNTSRTVSGRRKQPNTSATPPDTASREVPANNPSHVGTHTLDKGSPLKGEPSTGTHEGVGFSSPSLRETRIFEEEVRNGLITHQNVQLLTNSGIEIRIKTIGNKRFLAENGKIIEKSAALRVWREIMGRKEDVLLAFEMAKNMPQSIEQNGQKFINGRLTIQKDGVKEDWDVA